MQLAPVHFATVPPAPAIVTRPGQPWPLPPFAPSSVVAPSTVAAPPLIDFPGIVAGDQFDIAKGSKVGFITPSGRARIERFEPDAAAFRIQAGAFGQRVDMLVSVERIDDEHVRITQQRAGDPTPISAEGRIVASRENYAEFLSLDGQETRTVIQHDGAGRIVLDTRIPTFGAAHLVLQRRP